MSDIALWVDKNQNARVSFRDIRAPNLRVQIEKYFEGVLGIELPSSVEERDQLDLPPERERAIKALVSKTPGVSIEDGKLTLSSQYVEAASTLVFELVGRLNQLIADRYAYGPPSKT
jgi:hypothetical protein